MDIHKNRKFFIPITILILIAFIILGIFIWRLHGEVATYRNELENNYMKSVEELSDHMNNITVSLNKARFAGSSSQVTQLASILWKETSAAKSNLSSLPLTSANLNNTNKFFSQCGDYAMVLAKQLANQQPLTEEENKNLFILYDYAVVLQDQLHDLRTMLTEHEITINQIGKYLSDENIDDSGELENISNGFQDVENGFTGFPVLIYDGPFSDDLIEKEPIMTSNATPVTQDEARAKAAESIMKDISEIKDGDDEEGRMPSYGFKCGSIDISVTKGGGFVSYFIDGRDIGKAALTAEEAVIKAEEYIELLKIEGLVRTYYEIGDNVCIINYAGKQDDVICYTDLVKIEVALDDGQIVGFDARNFLTNHYQRNFPQIQISLEEAESRLNPNLIPESSKLALIPTAGMHESLTYEFYCITEDSQKILVYINVESGKEEQLLILIENESGNLTI